MGQGAPLERGGEASVEIVPSGLPLGVGRRSGKREDGETGKVRGACVRKLTWRTCEQVNFRGEGIEDDDRPNSQG